MGARLLATQTPAQTLYHHPDRLGTRLVTDKASAVEIAEQTTLPYGTALDGESWGAATNRRFTSYDRSQQTKLDYAVNRFYSSCQGRFTQVDPLGMGAVELDSPQSLNLYAYVGNDPINAIDPDGLFLKKLFGAIKKFFSNRIVIFAVLVALIVLTSGALGPLTFQPVLGSISLGGGATATVVGATQLTALGWATVGLSLLSGVALPNFAYGGFGTPPINGDAEAFSLQRGGGRGGRARPSQPRPRLQPYQSLPRNSGRPPRRPALSTTAPSFPNLKDHARRHGGNMTAEEYYNAAFDHVQSGQPGNGGITARVRAWHEGQWKWNYITRVGPDNFIFTSTSANGRVIFTHLRDIAAGGNDRVNLQYFRNKGITLPAGF